MQVIKSGVCLGSPRANKSCSADRSLACWQGVKLYFQHKVTRASPSPKHGDDGAVVVFTDLSDSKEFRICTDKAVLNIPAEVRTTDIFVVCFVVVVWS